MVLKQEPFRMQLPLLRRVVPVTTGIVASRLVVKGRCACGAILHIFNIGRTVSPNSFIQWNLT